MIITLNNQYNKLHVGFSTSRIAFSPCLFINNFKRAFSSSPLSYNNKIFSKLRVIFNKENLLKHLTLNKICFGLFVILVTTSIRYSGIASFILELLIGFSDEWVCWSLSGVLALFVKLPFRGVFDAIQFCSVDWRLFKSSWILVKSSGAQVKSLGVAFKSLDLKNLRYEFSKVNFSDLFRDLLSSVRNSIKLTYTGDSDKKGFKINGPKPLCTLNSDRDPTTKNTSSNSVHRGGYFKYHCIYWLSHNCSNYVWVNNVACARCLSNGVRVVNYNQYTDDKPLTETEKLVKSRIAELANEKDKIAVEKGKALSDKIGIRKGLNIQEQIRRGLTVYSDRPYPNAVFIENGWTYPKYTEQIEVGEGISKEVVRKLHKSNALGTTEITQVWITKGGGIMVTDNKCSYPKSTPDGLKPTNPSTKEVYFALDGKVIKPNWGRKMVLSQSPWGDNFSDIGNTSSNTSTNNVATNNTSTSSNTQCNTNPLTSVTGKRKRSYSTSTRPFNVSKHLLLSNTSVSSLNLNKRAFSSSLSSYSKSFKIGSPMFKNLNIIIRDNPINEETQIKIDKFLYEYSYMSLVNESKSKQSIGFKGINYSMINSRLTKVLFECESSLLKLINNFISDNLNKPDSKDGIEVLYKELANILNAVDNKYLTSIMHSYVLKILSNYKRSESNLSSVVGLSFDLGRDLVNYYYYKEYLKVKSKLEDKSYYLSNWKSDNKIILDKFEDNTVIFNIGSIVVGWWLTCKIVDKRQSQLIRKKKLM